MFLIFKIIYIADFGAVLLNVLDMSTSRDIVAETAFLFKMITYASTHYIDDTTITYVSKQIVY